MIHLDSLLATIAADFDNEVARGVLADYLDEQGAASAVELHAIPNWLRLRWLRMAPVRLRGRPRYTNGWAVLSEIQKNVGNLDHYGRTTIGGRLCFVDEPYPSNADFVLKLRDVARIVGCVDAYSNVSDWGHGTKRIILFPVFWKVDRLTLQ